MSEVSTLNAPTHRSYIDQCLHYLDRPHDGVPASTVEAPAAWKGSLLSRGDWRYELEDSQVEELHRALRAAKATGKPLSAWTRDDFPLPGFSKAIRAWRAQLTTGIGFLSIGGVPVEDWSTDDCECFFWAFGLHLGIPGAQNPQGELLGHIMDTGSSRDEEVIRLYQTPAHMAYHCDAADVVGLLCLQDALEGGESRIASSVAVWNEIADREPALARRLFEPVYVDLREETSPDGKPWNEVIPCRFADGQLRTFYHGDYFRSAARHAELDIPDSLLALYDLYDGIANSDEFALDMRLVPGDIQLLSNHTVLHGRASYRDSPTHRRHLLRLWLSLA